ncbi:hypothetical protein C8Q75DRAFT_544417 [Abortiporus biennis]|nr:hypothetical protein C8Q75DRAFT_544417 [Abortiporus biennis]
MQNIEEKPPAPSKTSSKRGKGSAARGSKSDTQPTRRSERIQASHDKAPKKTSETASAGEKRSLQDMTESETRKRSFPSIESGQEEKPAGREKPSVQSAVYASESLATGMMDFVMNIMIADEFVTVWYYDRQSPIQCSGIDFLKDFPRFLVLLFALQRLRPEQLGRNPWFSSQNICIPGEEDYKCHYYVKTSSDDSTALKITLDERHFSPTGILGRGTAVYNVRERHGFVSPSEKEKEEKLVLKASWPERSRVSENDMLNTIYSIIEALDVQDKQFVEGHVPRYLWASDISVHDTSKIRQKLGLLEIDPNTDHDGSRINRLLLFKKLSKSEEIFRREGGDKKNIDERFIKIWWDCLVCHFILWIKGVHHCDVSDGNLMYYTVDNGVHMGVLNDFDLATIDRDGTASRPTGNLRTGTQPFMAMDLLKKAGRKGGIPHLYRHDLESFIWILVWYSEPMIDGTPLDTNSWATSTAEYCWKDKNAFWTDYTDYTSDKHKRLFKLCKLLMRKMNKKVFWPMKHAMEYKGSGGESDLESDSESDSEAIVPRSSFTEPSPYKLFKALQKIVLAKYSFLSGLEPPVMERLKEKESDKK